MKKQFLLLLILVISGHAISQLWSELPAQYETNDIVSQSLSIDGSDQEKYVFYINAAGVGYVKQYDTVSQTWNELTNTTTLGISDPKFPSIIAYDSQLIIGIYDNLSTNYFIFKKNLSSFDPVGSPIFSTNPLIHSKLTYEGDLSNGFLLTSSNANGYEINLTHVDLNDGTPNNYAPILISATEATNSSNPDLVVSSTDIYVI